MWKTISATAIAVLLTFGMIRVFAGPIPYINPGQLAIPITGGDFNALINQINANALLSNGSAFTVGSAYTATSPAYPTVNNMTVTAGATGNPVTISASGSDTNVGIALTPQSSWPGQGVVQFANIYNWVPASGLQLCPGSPNGSPPPGVGRVVTEYLYIADWQGRTVAIPACGTPGSQLIQAN